MKPTGWMTNSRFIAKAVSERCTNALKATEEEKHAHAMLVGGRRASPTERYPVLLVIAILKALRAELISAGTLGSCDAGGPTVDEEDFVDKAARGGEYGDIYDRITGELLDSEGVAVAREEEMEFMRKLVVYESQTSRRRGRE